MIKELISKAQNGNKECMQQLICMFDPLLQKYARKLQKEDAYEDLVLSFIELVISIKLNNFAGCGDGTFVSYIQVSVGNCYKKILEKIIKDKSVICISDLSDEQRFYFDVKLSFSIKTIFQFFQRPIFSLIHRLPRPIRYSCNTCCTVSANINHIYNLIFPFI